MQKLKLLIFLFVLMVGFSIEINTVRAYTCTGWKCETTTDPRTGGTSQTCAGTPAGCDENGNPDWFCQDNPGAPGCGGVSCGPGKYACNRGCCTIGSGGGSCFPSGTKVMMASGEEKNIEEIVVGDEVLSLDYSGAKSVSKVQKLIQPISDNMCEIKFDDGDSLKVTKSHPLATTDGWKAISVEAAELENESVPVTELQKGDRMIREDGVEPTVISIECWSEDVQTYNFTVDNEHTYFAGRYLAHNKGGPTCRPGGDVDCPVGATISLKQPISTECWADAWGMQYCNPKGTAQRKTGCCVNEVRDPDDGTWFCGNEQVTTYTCCPSGTAETRHVGSTYAKINSCWSPTNCNNPNDQYVSYTQPASAGLCYVGCSEENPNTGNCRVGKSFNVYNAVTTCRTITYSCDSICDATIPENLNVVSGSILGTTAQMNWTPASGIGAGTVQYVRVGTDSAEVTAGCPGNAGRPACIYSGSVATNIGTKEIVGLSQQTTYYFMVVNYKTASCSKIVATTFTTPQSSGTISGTVYLDTFNTCSTASPTMDGVSVVMDGVTTDVSGPAGAYSFPALLNSSHTLNAAIPAGYICSNGATCAGNSCAVSGIVSPFPSRDFFMTLNRSAWWQAEGASVYAGSTAGGTTISSSIPSSVGASSRYLVLPGDGGTPALVMRATGNDPSVGEGSVNENSWSARASYKGKKMDYQYFASQMGVVKNQVSDWGGNGLNQQTADERDFWYMKPSAGPANISSNWIVNDNDSYVVFVDGDLEIDANITVQSGGFLALVVNGDITVGTGVDSLQGVFIASSDFITESAYVSGVSNDDPLAVEGTVVAWGTTSFARNLGTGNILTPAEKFSYRPDFLVNMPEKMKAFALEWTEVVAGTIEN